MKTLTLDVADGVHLPLDYVTKACAIFAQRRKGKTYTASVIAEELVKAGLPFVVLDPTGAWWGLRASADAKTAGLPVVIIGGEHGDLPLEREGGRFIADLVLEHPGWYVLDFSLLESRAAERQFATDFAERLYRRKQQRAEFKFPLHMFVDEADMFAPQDREDKGDVRMLGAFQAIVRRGGLHGLGTTLISQRPALVNKNVLTQLDLLILLRLVAGQDQDAVDKNYIGRHATKEQRAEMMASLASLPIGTGWFWEPGAEPPLFVRTAVRARHTFNSSATPKVGEVVVEPKRLAEVDLAELKEAMGEAVEKAKQDDPVELRKQIAELRKQLAAKPADAPAPPEVVRVPVLDAAAAARVGAALEAATGGLAVGLADTVVAFEKMLAPVSDEFRAVQSKIAELGADRDRKDVPRARPAGDRARPSVVQERRRPPERADPPPRRRETGSSPVSGSETLPRGERRCLTAIAQHPDGVTREQLTLLAGFKRSSRDQYINRLVRRGCVVVAGKRVQVTDAGLDALGSDYGPLPTGDALLKHWLGVLIGGERVILGELAAVWPAGMSRDEISERTPYKRSSRDAYLRRLGARELVVLDDGDPRAADLLFD